MILVCPACATKYIVKPAAFAGGARMVKCAKCAHQWLAAPPEGFDAPPADVMQEPPPAPKPLPPGSNLPAVIKKGLLGFFVTEQGFNWHLASLILIPVMVAIITLAAGLIFVYHRQDVVAANPQMAAEYQEQGLTVGDPGTGLELQEVRSEQKLDSGALRLVVEGKIVNSAAYAQEMPHLVATALGEDGKPVSTWEIQVKPVTLNPLQSTRFVSIVRYPDQAVAEVTLAFKAIDKEAEAAKAEAEAKELEELRAAASGGSTSSSSKKKPSGDHGGGSKH